MDFRTIFKALIYIGATILAVGCLGRILVPILLPKDARITSWWRSPAVNKLYGGHPRSRHLIGWAYDIVPAKQEWADKLQFWFKDVIIHDAGSGVHIHAEIV